MKEKAINIILITSFGLWVASFAAGYVLSKYQCQKGEFYETEAKYVQPVVIEPEKGLFILYDYEKYYEFSENNLSDLWLMLDTILKDGYSVGVYKYEDSYIKKK